MTPEKEAYLREQVAKGIMESTEHPSREEIDDALDWQEKHAFNEGLGDFLKARGCQDGSTEK